MTGRRTVLALLVCATCSLVAAGEAAAIDPDIGVGVPGVAGVPGPDHAIEVGTMPLAPTFETYGEHTDCSVTPQYPDWRRQDANTWIAYGRATIENCRQHEVRLCVDYLGGPRGSSEWETTGCVNYVHPHRNGTYYSAEAVFYCPSPQTRTATRWRLDWGTPHRSTLENYFPCT